MYCVHCGKEIEDNSRFCEYCGKKVPEELVQQEQQEYTPVYSVQPQILDYQQPTPLPEKPVTKKKSKKGIIIAVTAVALSIILVTVLAIVLPTVLSSDSSGDNPSLPTIGGDSDLQRDLMLDWTKEGTVTQLYYNYAVEFSLDFTDGILTCNYTNSGEETTFTAFRYKIISNNQIQRQGTDTVYTITVNKEKTTLTISPAITTTEESEVWYCKDNFTSEDINTLNAAIAALETELEKPWTRTDASYGYLSTYELRFYDGLLTYDYTTTQGVVGGDSFDYEIISGNQIRNLYSGAVYTVTFNDTKNVMTISPAISIAADSENWYLENSNASQQTGQNATVTTAEKNALLQKLKKTWTRTDGANGYYTEHELLFSDTWFSYNYTLTGGGGAGGNYDFEIIAANQIREIYSGIVYTISFNEAENVMTISPAISSTDSSDQWFYMK